uniref:GTPase activating protein (SH3 domain) binding protein 2 n=1 Tax=Gouania willdenowi TaxID=441366 RepID=A0A8C5HBT5_GOUWI
MEFLYGCLESCPTLFVGNLPQDIDKRELKEFFMTYGNVVNLWINTKSVKGNLPNFVFVVFDNSDFVQRILEAQVEGPIMFQCKVRLKVKERKPRAVREQETRPRRVDMAPKLSMGSGRGAALVCTSTPKRIFTLNTLDFVTNLIKGNTM